MIQFEENSSDQPVPENIHSHQANDVSAKSNEQPLMDYGDTAGDEPLSQEPVKETVGLMGGQPKNDDSGLDISQYTGPDSKHSSEFNDPEAPWHTGPGNGLSNGRKTEGAEWENPEPPNDTI